MTLDRIEIVPVNQVSKFISKFTNLFDYNSWLLISIIFSFIPHSFSLYLFNKNSDTKALLQYWINISFLFYNFFDFRYKFKIRI